MQTIEIPAMIMAAAAESGRQVLKDLIEKERNVDGFTDNAEELAATNAFFDSLVPEATTGDGMLSFSIPDTNNEWGETISEGTDPVAGGQGGMVTYPDGHQEPSKVPPQLWGTSLPWLKAAASTWRENVVTQAKTLIPEAVRNTMSEYSQQIGESVSGWVKEMLQQALGGAT